MSNLEMEQDYSYSPRPGCKMCDRKKEQNVELLIIIIIIYTFV